MATAEVLYAELNKLKKDHLIEIIVAGKVPESVSISEQVKQHINNNAAAKGVVRMHREAIHNLDEDINFVKIESELKVVKAELNCSERVVAEQERVISYQCEIIELLKSSKMQPRNHHGEVATLQKTSSDMGGGSLHKVGGAGLNARAKRTDKISSTNTCTGRQQPSVVRETSNDEPGESGAGWQEAARRKQRRNRATHGTNMDITNAKLQAVPKMAFLFVSRFAPETKVVDIKAFLRPNFPEVECEQLESRHPAHYSCFKVGVYMKNMDKALDPAIWPNDIFVNRFFRPRERNQSKE